MKLRKVLIVVIVAVTFVLVCLAIASCGLDDIKNSENGFPVSIEISSAFETVYPNAEGQLTATLKNNKGEMDYSTTDGFSFISDDENILYFITSNGNSKTTSTNPCTFHIAENINNIEDIPTVGVTVTYGSLSAEIELEIVSGIMHTVTFEYPDKNNQGEFIKENRNIYENYSLVQSGSEEPDIGFDDCYDCKWYVEGTQDEFDPSKKYVYHDDISVRAKLKLKNGLTLIDQLNKKSYSIEPVYYGEKLPNSDWSEYMPNDHDGWSFNGWYTDSSQDPDEEFIPGTEITSNSKYYCLSDTLIAKWGGNARLNLTQIIHNDDNKEIITREGTVGVFSASAVTEVPVIYHGAINLESSQIPTYSEGGDFGGWYTELYGAGEQITDNLGVGIYDSKNLNLYDKIIFNVNIDYNAATGNYDENNNNFKIIYGEFIDLVSNGLGRNPTKTGWTFGGWESEYANNCFEILDKEMQFTLLGDITITAIWTWTFNLNAVIKDYYLSQTKATIKFQDEFSSLPSLANWGSWSFDGWYTRRAGEGEVIRVDNYDSIVSSSSNISTLFAKWIIKTVILDDNIENNEDKHIENLVYGKTIKEQGYDEYLKIASSSRRAGYSTNDDTCGWYTDNVTYSVRVDENTSTYPQSMSTLFFKWKPDTYTVEFNFCGGQSTQESINITMGQSLTGRTISIPERSGENFGGYWTEETSGGHMYFDSQGKGTGVWVTPNPNPGQSITLYARWVNKVYRVYFDGNGGTCELSSITVLYGELMSDLDNNYTPTRTGFTFAGFYDNKEGTGTPYYNSSLKGETEWNRDDIDAITLYAAWNANELFITVKNGDNVLDEQTEYSVGGDYLTLSINVTGGTGDYSYSSSQSSNHLTILNDNSSKPQIKKNSDSSTGKVTITVVDGISEAQKSFELNYKTTASKTSCVAAGTLVTLADGKTKAIENVTVDDIILTFDHSTGAFKYSKVLYNVLYGFDKVAIVTLYFNDNTTIKFVNAGHGIYDVTLNRYVLINAENIKDYFGHKFLSSTVVNGEYSAKAVELCKYEISYEPIARYDIVTENEINCVLNNLITCSDALVGVCNTFEFASDYTYDLGQMARDIAIYGLYTYEEWSDYLTYEDFIAVNGAYFKITVCKGLITDKEIFELLEFLYLSRAL